MPKKKPKEEPQGVKIPQHAIKAKMKCRLCHQGRTTDRLHSGDFYSLTVKKQTYYYHYFCLLFSSEGVQRGQSEGIEGFLPQDIEKECKRGQSLICHLCNKNGATIPCASKKCSLKFHFSCGATYDTHEPEKEHFFMFAVAGMLAYCPQHAPKQRKHKKDYDNSCGVCLNELNEEDDKKKRDPGPGIGRIACPNSICIRVFHRWCIQEWASRSGKESFKCSMCGDKDLFTQEAGKLGIYVPEKPPDWELEPIYGWTTEHINFKQCVGSKREGKCLCREPEGPKLDRKGSKWELYTCDNCGGNSVHIECGKMNKQSPSFICDVCTKSENSDEEEILSDEEEIVEEKEEQEEDVSDDDDCIRRALQVYNKERLESSESSESSEDDEVCVVDEVKGVQSLQNESRKRKLEEMIDEALKDSPVQSEDDDCKEVSRCQGAVPKLRTAWGSPITIAPASDSPDCKTLKFGDTPAPYTYMSIPLVPCSSSQSRKSKSRTPARTPPRDVPPPPPSSYEIGSPLKYSFSVPSQKVSEVMTLDDSDDEDPSPRLQGQPSSLREPPTSLPLQKVSDLCTVRTPSPQQQQQRQPLAPQQQQQRQHQSLQQQQPIPEEIVLDDSDDDVDLSIQISDVMGSVMEEKAPGVISHKFIQSGTSDAPQSGTSGAPQSGTSGVHQSGTSGVLQSGTSGVHQSGTSGVHQSGPSGMHQTGTSHVHQTGASDKSAQSEYKKKSTVVSHTAAFRPPTAALIQPAALRPPTTAYSFSTSELQVSKDDEKDDEDDEVQILEELLPVPVPSMRRPPDSSHS